MFQAKCIAIDMDDNGMVTEDLEAKIIKFKPKMVYVIHTFQNPTGRTLSLERIQKIAELGSEYDVLILEDDPYRDIRYSGKDLLPIKAFDKTGHVVLASDEIMAKLFDAKTATNSHSSLLPQILCAEFFKRGYYPAHHKKLCDIHREKRDVMIESIDKYFPKGTKRTFPDGGFVHMGRAIWRNKHNRTVG
jgi:2-aminoadipate transaminase